MFYPSEDVTNREADAARSEGKIHIHVACGKS